MKTLFKRLSRVLLPTLLCTAATPGTATTAPALPDAEPAMWMVKDADTTIYLFGTFHALDGKSDWFNDEVREAFDASQDVVLEVITPEDPAALGPAIMKHAVDTSGRTLSSKLSSEGQKALAAALAAHKMPPTALDNFKPFFASLTLATLEFGKMGITPDHGSETVIKKAMAGTSKKLSAVETIEDQLGLFDSLPEAEQIRLLEMTLKDMGSMNKEISGMLESWTKGDAPAVAKLIQQSDTDSPALFKVMFADRNARWTEWVGKRLDQPGTVFMAVGAGHLAGDRSVVSMLEKRGLRVTRVQ